MGRERSPFVSLSIYLQIRKCPPRADHTPIWTHADLVMNCHCLLRTRLRYGDILVVVHEHLLRLSDQAIDLDASTVKAPSLSGNFPQTGFKFISKRSRKRFEENSFNFPS